MDNFNIEIKCEGYGLSAELEKENIIDNYPNILRLNFSYDELNRIIDTLNNLKFLIDYNKRKVEEARS
jgi:hypothetical protein